MANKPLKSLTFPGLSDKYTIPQIDNTLAVAGDAADAKKTGDELSSVKQDINDLESTKADKTADNPNMGAGYAGQLVSGKKTVDQKPYVFRKTPVDATMEYGKIVGATVNHNQLLPELSSTNGWAQFNYATTYTWGTNEVTLNASGYGDIQKDSFRTEANHVYITRIDYSNSDTTKDVSVRYKNGNDWVTENFSSGTQNTYVHGEKVFKPTTSGRVIYQAYNGSKFKNIQLTDLTAEFGSAIADRIYAMEQSTAGSGIAWIRSYGFFTKPYYAYSAPTLKSVSGLSAKVTRGWNQWNEEWEVGTYNTSTGAPQTNASYWRSKNYINIIPGATYYAKTSGDNLYCFWYDANKNFIRVSSGGFVNQVFTVPSNACYMNIVNVSRNSYDPSTKPVCINLSNPAKNGTYEPYTPHIYALDPDVTLRGILKLDANNEIYADGDVWSSDGKKQERYDEVDLGTLTWEYLGSGSNLYFAANIPGGNATANRTDIFYICSKYESIAPSETSNLGDKQICRTVNNMSRYFIKDSAYTDAATFKTAMDGVKLVFEKSTPSESEVATFQSPQIVNPDGTEQFVFDADAFEMPVGHYSEYPLNVAGQLDEILDAPSTDGTYVLQATVSSGAVSYEWVSAS